MPTVHAPRKLRTVTVTVALPSATPVTVTVESETLAVAKPVSDDVAV